MAASKTARASMKTPGVVKEVISDEVYIKNLRNDVVSKLHVTQEGAKALLRAYDSLTLLLMAKQLEIDNALLLLNRHLQGRKDEGGYKDLDDALRQLLQGFISNRDFIDELKAAHPEIFQPAPDAYISTERVEVLTEEPGLTPVTQGTDSIGA